MRILMLETQRFLLAALIAFAGGQPPQLPQRLENCLPYPTFAQEVRQMQEERRRKEPPPKRINIESLIVKSDSPLPGVPAAQLIAEIKSKIDGSEDSPNNIWLEELTERLRDGLQHLGYFKTVVAEPQEQVLRKNMKTKTVSVTVAVRPGAVYRLSEIRFSQSTIADPEQMRSLFPIRSGEIFDTHKLSEGMDGLRYLYGEQGFINFAAVPSFDVDESRGLITLILDLGEDKQFRVGEFTILGLEASLVQKLIAKSGLAPGSIFNPRLMKELFETNQPVLPSDADRNNDVRYKVNEQAGTVDIIMDFRTCPK